MYLKALGELHCWKQYGTPREHMQCGCPAQRTRSQVLQNTVYAPRVLIQKGTGGKKHPTRLSSQAAVCKVLQRLLFVQKVPPFQCHSNI